MKTKRLLYSTIALTILMISSCEDDSVNGNFEGDPAIRSGLETIDFGEVVAGQTASVSTYVIGTGIDDGLSLTVEGEGYHINRDHFRIVTDTSLLEITFAPDIDAVLGDTPGTITLSAGKITSTIQLSAIVRSPSVITTSISEVTMGDVPAGTSDSKTVTVEGQYIPGTVDVSVTGGGFSVSPSSFAVGNGTHDLIVTFEAAASAEPGPVTGEVVFSYGAGLTSTLPVSANITLLPPMALPDGTVIYQNDFEFPNAPADDTPFTVTDLEGLSTTLYEGVSASYAMTVATIADDPDFEGAYMETSFAMCVATISDGEADRGECGISIGLAQLGTQVTVSLSGLPKLEADYTVTFWARPGATSEREMITSFGGTDFILAFNSSGGAAYAREKYYKFEIKGSSDVNGNLEFMFGNNTDNKFRGIDFDNIEIVAGG